MWTALPVKASPIDPPLRRDERELKVDRLRQTKALGEKYYDQMYEAGTALPVFTAIRKTLSAMPSRWRMNWG